MDDATKNIIDTVFGVIQTAVILGTAIWAYFRFSREGVHEPRIEFDVECSFLGPQQDRYLAAFIIHATNRGNVEQVFPEIRLRIRGIESEAPLKTWKGREPLLQFPEKMDPCTFNIIPEKMEYYFVRPGVHQRFSFVTTVPASWKFIVAWASFKYKETKEIHTAERAFEVKAA